MLAFWEKIILPLLQLYGVKKIVEVGAENGWNTAHLLQYCRAANGELFVIDPAPRFDVQEYKRLFHKEFHMLLDYSLEILPHLQPYDCILIDGDHNWYTVYHELKWVEAMAAQRGSFPLVFLHDTQWPYGRRDMYYFPESIPAAYLHPYAKKGMQYGRSELLEFGGANDILYNALYENGERNGVLTAVEDFLKQTPWPVTFLQAHTNSGLGIIVPKNEAVDLHVQTLIAASGL
ncbi:class I SAM-dependent methyltransferase [Paenibacillus alvei]|uniref:Class I SAM-dependent methyltransferase n=1 Tax=Paenibacillus alvei TaxID=44250 RepID=A0AAP7A005_PAEAL|nr:class I SAM-dependent methyltransferase [Paenibacillus alvei]NEZ43539.1 class I SAM-dependent methyltransferase [Paenibacillus alvei]NOJ70378.1 class I SAM-dependent methyltransferase [Paenibacillus alvei]